MDKDIRKAEYVDPLRLASGGINDNDPLVAFFYDLLRDHLPPSTVETLVKTVEQHAGKLVKYTNGFIAQYAQNLTSRLTKLLTKPPTQLSELQAKDVEWIVNDNAELGVKIGERCFFLWKGNSLTYGKARDGDRPMRYRPVYKREFGEACHPPSLDFSDSPKPPVPPNGLESGTYRWGDPADWKILPPMPEEK